MGEISAEEFYGQEALDYESASQQQVQQRSTGTYQGGERDISTKLRKFHANPMLADHHAESFDMHFEHTKKERHDRMMARLQLQEK
jgi:hypothetical protein